MIDTASFWESRARRFAGEGAGLRAVCSYAMPGLYNWAIDLTQRSALKRLIRSIPPGARVLDYGCGIGRWTREIARRGAMVTGVDFSGSMLAQATSRTNLAGLSLSCRFIQSDITDLKLPDCFDVIVGVTVLQHILDENRLSRTIACLASHLKPGGRLIVLEAAPSRAYSQADTLTFCARTLSSYTSRIAASGLNIEEIRGVDPSPLKLWVVPRFNAWSSMIACAALAAATLCSLPFDLLLARYLTRHSWHKVIVARAPGGSP
jgi:ubiquinone/menaquinone biosynthesis C-methylase UbiE